MTSNQAGEYLENIGWGTYNTKVFIQCGLAWTTDMLWSTNVAYILDGTKNEFKLSGVETGIIGSCFPLGLMMGAFYWGIAGDKYGRMYAFKNTVCVAAISSLILTLSSHPFLVGVSLFFLGAGMGGELSLGGTVFCEFCPPSKLYLLTRMAVFWGVGGTLSAVIALLVIMFNTSVITTWRILSGIGFLIELICVIFRFSLEETPAFHLGQGNLGHLENVLNNISLENTSNSFILNNNREAGNNEQQEVTSWYLITRLFEGKNFRTTVGLGIMYSSAAFGYTSILYFMPEFLESLDMITAYAIICLQQLLGIPGTMLGSCLVETVLGRRFTILVSFVLGSVCCLLFYLDSSTISVIAKQIIISTSLLNLVAIMGYSAMYTIAPESYPAEIRNIGVSTANISARITAIICPIVTGWMLSQEGGTSISIIIFAGFFLVTGFSALILTETRPTENKETELTQKFIH